MMNLEPSQEVLRCTKCFLAGSATVLRRKCYDDIDLNLLLRNQLMTSRPFRLNTVAYFDLYIEHI